MSKRVSGTPRHPRSPVAKAVRTPAFKMRVVPDKRWQKKINQAGESAVTPDETEDKSHVGESEQD